MFPVCTFVDIPVAPKFLCAATVNLACFNHELWSAKRFHSKADSEDVFIAMNTTPRTISEPLTFTYKLVNVLPLLIDVYPPSFPAGSRPDVPTVIYFHGGGLTVGNRLSWFPSWLQKRLSSLGVALISADYRLLSPSTGHDVLQDIKDLFKYVGHGLNQAIDEDCISRGVPAFHINPDAIAVSGTSSGGLCAYLAAMHATPRPVAVLSMYGMCGDCLTPHYLQPKTKPFFRGREILAPDRFQEYLYPECEALPPVSESPLVYYPKDSPTPGFPANPRMFITRLYLQQGDFLDYYTGDHHLSDRLRPNPSRSLIPTAHTSLFPQFGVTADWPPTLLIHGTEDTAVPIHDSQLMKKLLDDAKVEVKLVEVEGQEHSFDYELDADRLFGGKDGLFDQIVAFLVTRLKQAQKN